MCDYFQVANKLLELHVHLKDLGHPQYLKPTVTCYLECKTHSERADGEVCTCVCLNCLLSTLTVYIYTFVFPIAHTYVYTCTYANIHIHLYVLG